jgi:DNA-binding NtrC family response regulator
MKKDSAEEKKDLESTLKEKVSPLLEESMERNWGITIPKLESDITDRLKNPHIHVYIPMHLPFIDARKAFKREFVKKELQLHLGNISQLAKLLGLDRRSIHRTIKELDINIENIRRKDHTSEDYEREVIHKSIHATLEPYRKILTPEKMEKIYQDVPELSRNIAKVLPHQTMTWKEAEVEFEKQFIANALKENSWNVTETARKIKIRVETLYRKIKKLGLKEELQ